MPIGLAIDAGANLYVADSGNYTIRKVTSSGVVTTLAGAPGSAGTADGTGSTARFSNLKGIAVDSAGNVYAVDNHAVRKITAAGVVTTLAGSVSASGDADGVGTAARFNQPWGIAADAGGNVYVADTGNLLVRRIAPDGTVSTHAGTRGMRGNADGSRTTATFLGPRGIAIDPSGTLTITDWYGPPAPNIPEGSTFIRRIATDGSVTTLAGSFRGESASAQTFMDTFAIAADGSGNVYVAAMRSVQRISSTGAVSTVVASSPQFQSLEGIAIDATGSLLVADTSSHAISRVTQQGAISLAAGAPGQPGHADVAP